MNSAPVALTGLLILLIGGCQQPTNPAIPLSPISPMGANTRVPPPQTGSYAVPNGYYQGQASVAAPAANQYAAGGMAPAMVGVAPAVASGPIAASADLASTGMPIQNGPMQNGATLNGWSDATASAPAAVQPAAYQEASAPANFSSHATVGFEPTPRIPAAAMQSSSGGAAPLTPNMGGMEVIDMTAPETLRPTDPPNLQEIQPAPMRTASRMDSSAAPSFRSLSPAVANPAVASPVVAASAETASEPARAAPSTTKSADSGELPWRKPTR